jgi:hypothetical protein
LTTGTPFILRVAPIQLGTPFEHCTKELNALIPGECYSDDKDDSSSSSSSSLLDDDDSDDDPETETKSKSKSRNVLDESSHATASLVKGARLAHAMG